MIEQSTQNDVDDRFNLNIYRMELERVKFIMKSYLRTRLAKIERNLVYIIEKDRSELLSEAEKIFAFNVLEARKTHFQQSFFEKVPRELNVFEQDPVPDRVSKYYLNLKLIFLFSVTQPNPNEFVFVRMRIGKDSYQILDEIEVQLLEDQVYFLPYNCVRYVHFATFFGII